MVESRMQQVASAVGWRKAEVAAKHTESTVRTRGMQCRGRRWGSSAGMMPGRCKNLWVCCRECQIGRISNSFRANCVKLLPLAAEAMKTTWRATFSSRQLALAVKGGLLTWLGQEPLKNLLFCTSLAMPLVCKHSQLTHSQHMGCDSLHTQKVQLWHFLKHPSGVLLSHLPPFTYTLLLLQHVLPFLLNGSPWLRVSLEDFGRFPVRWVAIRNMAFSMVVHHSCLSPLLHYYDPSDASHPRQPGFECLLICFWMGIFFWFFICSCWLFLLAFFFCAFSFILDRLWCHVMFVWN